MSEANGANMPHPANGAAAPLQLPPLYRALEALVPERHAALRLANAGYRFAAGAAVVPLAVEEFVVAARTLPIVFGDQPPHLPIALTSLAPGHSLAVDAAGQWRPGTYIPAYLRRYPFFLVRVAGGTDELALCVDPSAPQLSTEQGEAMFEADKPTKILEAAMGFAQQVEIAMQRTRGITEALSALGLLQPGVVQFVQDGKPVRIEGFYAVDRPALAALPAEKLAELRDQGWLEAIYAHLLSIGGLPELAVRGGG
jgi:hypothetical protein